MRTMRGYYIKEGLVTINPLESDMWCCCRISRVLFDVVLSGSHLPEALSIRKDSLKCLQAGTGRIADAIGRRSCADTSIAENHIDSRRTTEVIPTLPKARRRETPSGD